MRAISRRTFATVISLGALTRARIALAEPRAIAHFSTTFATTPESHGRTINLGIAAEAIDGHVVAPGEIFSFNDRVGERTASFGYAQANVIRDRMMAEGTGGGTCQVASTLHAAALLAGLAITSRAPHSRPSGYIRMGLDATVVFPTVDLKFTNARATPITLRARTIRGTLDVRIEGEGTRPNVSITSEVLSRTPWTRTILHEDGITDDIVHVRVHGIPGYEIRRVRTIEHENGTIMQDARVDTYLVTPSVVAVSTTFDERRLAGAIDRADTEGIPDPPTTSPHSARAPIFRDDRGVARPTGTQRWPATLVTFTNDA